MTLNFQQGKCHLNDRCSLVYAVVIILNEYEFANALDNHVEFIGLALSLWIGNSLPIN